MVEGGGRMHTQFLTAGLADELQLVVAPFFVGDSRAPRFTYDGVFPWNPQRRARLAEVVTLGDVVLRRYARPIGIQGHEQRVLEGPEWLSKAVELSR